MTTPRSRKQYDAAMAQGAAEYQDVLNALNEAGLSAHFTQTGGMNAALEVQLENGAHLLLTDAENGLAWRRCEQRGWGVGLYRSAELGDGPDRFASTAATETDALLAVIKQVLAPATQPVGPYPRIHADTAGAGVVSHAGALLLTDTIRTAGLDRGRSQALAPWRKPTAVHDPGKIVCDLAVSLAVGGDCLADIAALRESPEVFGSVASDPTVSRLIDTSRR